MRTQTKLTLALALVIGIGGVLQTGCVVRARAGVAAPAPSLVMVDGLWVVEDYDRPIFWQSNFYWWNSGGIWYRSSYYDGGWTRVHVTAVPVRIRGVRRPNRYVRYRATNARQRRAIRNSYRHQNVRQNRRDARQNRRDYRQDRRQNRRDVRQDRRDYRRDRREDRRDARKEKRENRKERREDRKERRRDYRRDR